MSDLIRAMPMPETMKRHRRRSGKLVLLSLADDANDVGGSAFPSRQTIAFESEITPRTVDSLLHELMRERLIAEEAPPRQHPNRPRTYRINVERVRELVPPDAWAKYDALRVANSAGEGGKFDGQARKFEPAGSQDRATDPLDPLNEGGTGRAPARQFPSPAKASLNGHGRRPTRQEIRERNEAHLAALDEQLRSGTGD